MTSATPPADETATPGPAFPSPRRGTLPTANRLTPAELAALREDARLAAIQIKKRLAESPPPTTES